MNAVTGLLSLVLVSFAAAAPVRAQDTDRATRVRVMRQGAKPGEIITAPDLSERWRDLLRVGEAAPEFTLPLASGAEEAKALVRRDKQDSGRKNKARKANDALKTVSLKELRAKKPV